MRVDVVDPSAYTPPYDHALCRALAAAGAQVTLVTSRFAHGRTPVPEGYERREEFYRLAARGGARTRRARKLAEHVPEMLRYRTRSAPVDVVHFQWLAVQWLDGVLLPARSTPGRVRRPLVLTAHDILPREPWPGQRRAQRRLYDRFDAVVAHSEHGAERLGALGVAPERIRVIPHGVLRPWEGLPQAPLPNELRDVEGPVVLFFGLLRPYKGIDVLLEAWRGLRSAELWIVGKPRMRPRELRRLRTAAPENVRWLERFVSDAEMHALMRRAELLVLPYREIEQSGVAFAGLGAGVPMLLSDAGALPELAATGAARLFASGSAPALRSALDQLLAEPAARARMAAAAAAAAAGELSWERIAGRTLELYRELLA